MKLTSTQLAKLQSALLASFYSESDLNQMVRIQLDRNLAAIASGDNLSSTIFELIGWAERTGNLKSLLDGAHAHNPGNAELKMWMNTYSDALDSQLFSDATVASTEPLSTNIPWWNRLGSNNIDGMDIDNVRGEVIIGNVGSGASNIAIGKNITQQIYEILGKPMPDDAQSIIEQFDALESSLTSVHEQTRSIVEMQLDLLKSELIKTDVNEVPSTNTITKVGDWLLDNVPELNDELVTLFELPAVGKVLAKAGEIAIQWVRENFG